MTTPEEWIAANHEMLDAITRNTVQAYDRLEGDSVKQEEFKMHLAMMALASQSGDELTIENAKEGLRGFLVGLGTPSTKCHVGDIRTVSNELYNMVSQSL